MTIKIPKVTYRLETGFTLVEMMVVLGLFLVVFTISNVSLSGMIAKHSTEEFAEVFQSDARRQQMRAISGERSLDGNLSYGIKYNNNNYVLFSGTYSEVSPNNITVDLPSDIQFADITFPNQEIIFAKGSGEVTNFVSSSATVSIRNTSTNEDTRLRINQLGVLTKE